MECNNLFLINKKQQKCFLISLSTLYDVFLSAIIVGTHNMYQWLYAVYNFFLADDCVVTHFSNEWHITLSYEMMIVMISYS